MNRAASEVTEPAGDGQLALRSRNWVACQSTHVAQMEYCYEPWVRSPAWASRAFQDHQEGARCTG